MDIKQQRGQFFTTNPRVHSVMHALIQNKKGLVLEPSAGAGDLLLQLEENPAYTIEAVELDNTIAKNCVSNIVYQDFFVYAVGKENRYQLIFGNPPYVAWKSLEDSTKVSAASVKEGYPDKTNLYHLFIDRCIDLLADGGEMIFIVPKEWLYTSSANKLRQKIVAEGTLTHIIDCGEEKLFSDADVPALLIYRFVKGKPSNQSQFAPTLDEADKGKYETRTLVNRDGRLMLLGNTLSKEISSWGQVKDSFSVKVGIVSGADGIYRLVDKNSVEASAQKEYLTTKGIESFIDCNDFDTEASIPKKALAFLKTHKTALISRKISKFTDANWWKYGAIRNKEAMVSNKERFYAIVKTRSATPFFKSPATLYSGGILGIFKNGDVTVDNAVKIMNSKPYREIMEAMFLTTGNKVSLQPATLEDAPFPKNNVDALAFIKKHGL